MIDDSHVAFGTSVGHHWTEKLMNTGEGDFAEVIERFYGKTTQLSPEKKLLLAVLELGIADRDLVWVKRRTYDGPFCFAAICAEFGIDPDAARQALVRRFEAPAAVRRRVVGWKIRTDILDVPGRTYDHRYGECGMAAKCPPCRERYEFTRRKKRWARQKERRRQAAGIRQQMAAAAL